MAGSPQSPFLPLKIIIHHSATFDGPLASWPAIRRYHIEHNNFADIGYHAGAELIGGSYEVLMGRPWDRPGAHTLHHNGDSLGFCFVGDFNVAPPASAQLIAGARVVALWLRLFGIPITEIYPHLVFNETDCPGALFDVEAFRTIVKAAL
jgi:hypothetical protein